MTKIIPGILVLLFFSSANTVKSQDVLTKITDGCCTCFHAIDTSLKGDALTAQLGICMIKFAGPYKRELKTKFNIDLDDKSGKQWLELGKEVGLKMAVQCPDRLMLFSGSIKKDVKVTVGGQDKYLVGIFTEFQKNQFVTVLITDVNGRTQKLLWLDYFKNSEWFKKPDNLKSQELKFYYREMEFYNPQLEDYMEYKVLTGLEKE